MLHEVHTLLTLREGSCRNCEARTMQERIEFNEGDIGLAGGIQAETYWAAAGGMCVHICLYTYTHIVSMWTCTCIGECVCNYM